MAFYMAKIAIIIYQPKMDLWVRGQPALQSEFQHTQGSTEKPCFEKNQMKKQKEKKSLPSKYCFCIY